VSAALARVGLQCVATTRDRTVAGLWREEMADAILVLRDMSPTTQRQFLEEVRQHPTLHRAPVMLVGSECNMDPVVAELLAASLQCQVSA
jgi:hypothetical protein